MAKLTKAQIDELKNMGFVTSVDASEALASQSVDELKEMNYVTQVVPSADIEAAVTPVSSSAPESGSTPESGSEPGGE